MKVQQIRMTPAETGALQKLQQSRVVRVISNRAGFAFELGSRYLHARVAHLPVFSEDADEEAVAIRPAWEDGHSVVTGETLAANVRIGTVLVVRTLLWFTDYERSDEPQPELNVPKLGATDWPAGGNMYAHEECCTNPNRPEEVQARTASLVDVGFAAEVEGRLLACFSQFNATVRTADYIDELGDDFARCYTLEPISGRALGQPR